MRGLRRILAHPAASPAVLGSLFESITLRQSMQPAAQLTKLSNFSSSSSAAATAAPLFSACVFERLPVVMPEAPSWEIEHAEWQAKLMEKRMKSMPKEFTDDKRMAEEQGGGAAEARWKPAPLETAADKSGDRRTTRRRLDQRIFLLLKQSNGTWEFPHVSLEGGETTRSAAERALKEALGEDGFQPYFVGNAPAGHVALSNGTVFFHRCQLIQGTPKLAATTGKGKWLEFAWAAKDELGEYIKDKETLDVLQKML